MATNKTPTKAEFLEALSKKGINSLEDLIEAVMPEPDEPDETGGYVFRMAGEGSDAPDYLTDMFQKFSGHGPDGWMIPVAAGIHSLYGEFSD